MSVPERHYIGKIEPSGRRGLPVCHLTRTVQMRNCDYDVSPPVSVSVIAHSVE